MTVQQILFGDLALRTLVMLNGLGSNVDDDGKVLNTIFQLFRF